MLIREFVQNPAFDVNCYVKIFDSTKEAGWKGKIPVYDGPGTPIYASEDVLSMELSSVTTDQNDIILEGIRRDGAVPEKEPETRPEGHKECQKSKLQDRCRNYAREAFVAYDSVECEKGCAGILYEDTTLTIKKGRVTLWGYQFKTPPFQVSVPAWKKNLEKHVKAIDAELNHLAEEEERKFRTRYQIFFDSLLARDILEFIIANERYITANAVAQAMRGTAIALDTAIKKTDGCGRSMPTRSRAWLRS